MFDPATIVKLLRAEGRNVTLTDPPNFVEDADGVPVGLEPGGSHPGTLAGPILTAAQWEQVARYLLSELDQQGRER